MWAISQFFHFFLSGSRFFFLTLLWGKIAKDFFFQDKIFFNFFYYFLFLQQQMHRQWFDSLKWKRFFCCWRPKKKYKKTRFETKWNLQHFSLHFVFVEITVVDIYINIFVLKMLNLIKFSLKNFSVYLIWKLLIQLC